MTLCSPFARTAVLLITSSCLPAGAHRLLRTKLPRRIDPTSEVPSPLDHLEEIADPIEDIEQRQKGPHVLPEEINQNGALMAGDLADLLDQKRDDFRDCVVVHQYAEPLHVGDTVRETETYLNHDDDSYALPPLLRSGAVFDESSTNHSVPLAIEMFAQLMGITGMVQVIPHGPMAHWTSKQKVPIGGFLCNHDDQSASAPVLHATPTPCIPTALDKSGKALNPIEDGYEVFIGTTRVSFDNKTAADKFCTEYARRISSDLSRTVWDASSLGEVLPQKNPSLASFVSLTGKLTSAEGWTKGRKKVLVLVMDWKVGDQTLSPYSKQDSDPIPHYKSTIFPAVNQAFEQMSYGQFGIDVTFVPKVIHYNRDRNRYTARKMPFPALYDAARESLEGQTSDYKFDSYDLVYVIAPQVKPTGTKGVAWVGQKGAMCNGCETISDKFKIMVAVHEMGHNLGLLHASSTALEYGNPFDWMGNYPDVLGLNYGLGYVWSLGWLPADSIYTVGDQDLPGLSTKVVITPHDVSTKPKPGQIIGVRVTLSSNSRDLWVSFRSSPEGYRSGVFLVEQDKDEANSELIDSACHSPSQQDASLRDGWVYLDSSHHLAVTVLEVTESTAVVQVFEAKADDVPNIYGLPTFTDGVTKCPVTCQDANWLMTGYNCKTLKEQGYCNKGSLTVQGKKYSIGFEICPQECGKCEDVMKRTPLTVKGGCQDHSIEISGKGCKEAANAGWCSYSTKSGSSVGKDLCPASCGACPKTVAPGSTAFTIPPPKMTVGDGTAARPIEPSTSPPPSPAPTTTQDDDTTTTQDDDTTTDLGPSPAPATQDDSTEETGGDDDGDSDSDGDADDDDEGGQEGCADDSSWSDKDGDTCSDYAKIIRAGKWTQEKACNYDKGTAKQYCRKTCETCTPSTSTCADNTCINAFKEATGRCEQCADWSRFCKGKTASWFRTECPLTCGDCTPSRPAPREMASSPTAGPDACTDDDCIVAWKTKDKCPTCSEMGNSFCSEQVFAAACRKTCNLCANGTVVDECKDVFASYTCSRYKSYGWCQRSDMREPVSRQCPETCGVCTGNQSAPGSPGRLYRPRSRAARGGRSAPEERSSAFPHSAPKSACAAVLLAALGLAMAA